MTCITSQGGNRHTTRHHQRESPALDPARQNRYTDPLHTASADRSRSYITHLIEAGWDPLFVQQQAGHQHASTTSSAVQVWRLVTQTPERLSLAVLAALCDILAVTPADLVLTRAENLAPCRAAAAGAAVSGLGEPRPRRALLKPGP